MGLLPEHVRGREGFLRKLEKQFRDGGLVVLVGAGGMGKSTISRELARRISQPGAAEEPMLCWEVSGATQPDFTASMITVARDLNASEEVLETIAASKPPGPELTWKLLEHEDKRWLLIIDNADEPDFLAGPGVPGATLPTLAQGRGWVRTSPHGLMLISSRDTGEDRPVNLWPTQAILMKVPGLSDSEAAKVLHDLAPHAGDRTQARALAHRLGGLPLALHLVGRYLNSEFVDYANFDAFRLALERDPKVIRVLDRTDDPAILGRVMVVFTWELSLSALAKRGLPQARPLLRLLSSYASPLPIPLNILKAEILDRVLTKAADLDSPVAGIRVPISRILDGLASVGLIDSVPLRNNKALRVHPVIADTNRLHLLAPELSDPAPLPIRQTAVEVLAASLDDLDEDLPADWPSFRDITPHLKAIIASLTPGAPEGDPRGLDGSHVETLIRLAGHAAMAYGKMRLPAFGIDLVASALALRDGGSENSSQIILLARQQQAFLLGMENQHKKAEQIYREVLQVQLRLWPIDDPANLAVRHNLATSLGAHGRWSEAQADFLKVLDDERRVLGHDHPTTLTTRRGIATLLCRKGTWDQAENELRDLLDDEIRLLGAGNRTTFATRFNLAQALRHQGRNDEAEAAISDLLQDARQILGEEHPTTVAIREFEEGIVLVPSLFTSPAMREKHAQSLFDKAIGLTEDKDSPEKLEEAAAVYQELADRYGDDPGPALRSLTATALLNKGVVLGWLDRAEDSLAAYQEVLDRFGGDPVLRNRAAQALQAKAAMLAGLGRAQEALPVIEQAVSQYRELAEDDPQTYEADLASAQQLHAKIETQAAQSLFDKANGLTEDKDSPEKLEEAAAVYQELADRYGDDPAPALRSLTATALLNKGVVLGWLDRPEDSLAAYQEVLDRFSSDPTPSFHDRVAKALHAKAAILAGSGRAQEALPVIEQAVALYRELADADPQTYEPALASAQRLHAKIETQAAQSLLDQGEEQTSGNDGK
jgi:tetratricopeptide (TPR) repeat protein